MGKDSIYVCCRFRPQNKLEKGKGCCRVIAISDCQTVVQVTNVHMQNKVYRFKFDKVFDTNSSQPAVFNDTAKGLVDNVMDGYNCTIFAYGQTGTGKTYSMEGELGSPSRGIVPRVVETIFQKIQETDERIEFTLKVSYCEIYLERLRDLLNPKNKQLKIRENNNGVYIAGISSWYVRDEKDVMDLMMMGADSRTTQSTNMNAVSSRSHGVFMLMLNSKDTETGSQKMSKLMMVDLAGSEKVSKTGAQGSALEEAKKINQSLSALGNVMNSLTEGGNHIPYRDSVLTKLLSDSLGGNCKTVLLIAASESSYSVEETVNTMRFGERAKKIKNTAKINAEKTIAEYKREAITMKKKIVKQSKMIQCLQHDLELSKNGLLTDENSLVAKLKAGEDVVLARENESEDEDNRDDLMNASFGGIDAGKKKETKQMEPEMKTGVPDSPPAPFSSKLAPPNARAVMEPTADGGIFSLGDRITDIDGTRSGVVQRVFYVEDVDVRWDNNAVSYKIPAPNLILVEDDEEPIDGDELEALEPDVDLDLEPDSPAPRISPRAPPSRNHLDAGQRPPHLEDPPSRRGSMQGSPRAPPTKPGHHTRPSTGGTLPNQLPPSPMHSRRSSRGHNRTPSGSPRRGSASSPRRGSASSPRRGGERQQARVSWNKYQQATKLALDLQKEIDRLQLGHKDMKEALLKATARIATVDTELTIKSEALQKERMKTEEAEAECGKAVLKLRALDDQHSTLKYEKKKLLREITELKHMVEGQERERGKLRQKIEVLKKEAETELNKVRSEEKERAKKFIEAAQKAINRTANPAKRLMRENERLRGSIKNRRGVSSTRVDQEGLKEMQALKLQQLKLEQDLMSKVEDYLLLKMKVVEKDEQLEHLTNDVKIKDMRLRHQHDELSALGKLKLESDKYHSEKAARDQERILKLKRIIAKLKQKRASGIGGGGRISKTRQKKMRAVKVSLRGGGGAPRKKSRSNSKRKSRSKGRGARRRGSRSDQKSDKGSPTGSVASSATGNKYKTYGNYGASTDGYGSEFKDDASATGSQISYASYSGAYYGGQTAGLQDLPDIPDDSQSVISDVHSTYSGYANPSYQYYPSHNTTYDPYAYGQAGAHGAYAGVGRSSTT